MEFVFLIYTRLCAKISIETNMFIKYAVFPFTRTPSYYKLLVGAFENPLDPQAAGGVFHTLACRPGVFSDTVNHSKSVRNRFTVK